MSWDVIRVSKLHCRTQTCSTEDLRQAEVDRDHVDDRMQVHHKEKIRDEAIEYLDKEVPEDADIWRQVRVLGDPHVRFLDQHGKQSDEQ